MEEKVKQRLIGVIVIIGALFIILPFLFHNSRPSAQSTLSSNASAPAVSVAIPTVTPAAQNTTLAEAQTTQPTQMPDVTAQATQTTQPTQTPDATTSTSQATQAPSATTSTSQATQAPSATTQVAQTPDTTTQPTQAPAPSSSSAFSNASPNALTTGQANEEPTQSMQPIQSVSAMQNTPAPVKHTVEKHAVEKKHVAVKHEEQAAPKLAAHENAHAWEIQLAVFSDKSYANKLIAKLRMHHFAVNSRVIVINHRRLTAVFVGPELSVHKAEMLQRRLKQEFHINGMIKKV